MTNPAGGIKLLLASWRPWACPWLVSERKNYPPQTPRSPWAGCCGARLTPKRPLHWFQDRGDRHLAERQGAGPAKTACLPNAVGWPLGGLRAPPRTRRTGSIPPGRCCWRWETNPIKAASDRLVGRLFGRRDRGPTNPSWRWIPGARRRRVYHGVDQWPPCADCLRVGPSCSKRLVLPRQSRQRGRLVRPSPNLFVA